MKVFIIIPTRNRKDSINKCLESLRAQTYKNIHITVVDDGSTDGTSELIKGQTGDVNLLQGDGSLWWTGAVRKGVSSVLSQAEETDYILLQNDDTFVKPDFVEKLITLSVANNRMVLGSAVASASSGDVAHNAHRVLYGLFRPVLVHSVDRVIETDTLSGRGVLVPVEVFRKVGTFSKLFPHYGADYDFFCRVKKEGFRIGVSRDLVTYSTSKTPNLAQKIKARGSLSFYDIKQLYFSRRSSNNLYSSFLLTLLHVPFRVKLLGTGRILLFFVKSLLVNCLVNYYLLNKRSGYFCA